MTKNDICKQINLLKKSAIIHSPDILTVAGVAGFISSTIYGIKVTPEAMELIEKTKKAKGDDLNKKEIVQTAGTKYIPVGVGILMSTAAIFGARKIDYKRYSALLAAYKISENNLKEYSDKVKEVIGEKKEQKVKDLIAQDAIKRDPLNESAIIDCDGNTLCYDVLSGRYFKSSAEAIRHAVNEMDYRLMNEMYISLNDFYGEIGLEEIKLGDMLGWNINEGLISVDFSTQLASNEEPCLVLDYLVAPRYKFAENY